MGSGMTADQDVRESDRERDVVHGMNRAPGDVRELAGTLIDAVDAVVAGRREAISMSVACLLAGGHLLIEDIPGVGKTLLAQALAAS